jgi:hypothetical protein
MLVVTGVFENERFIPDMPINFPQKKRVVVTIEEQYDEWGHLAEGKLFSIAETAGIAGEWKNGISISDNIKSAWAEAAVAKEVRKQEET